MKSKGHVKNVQHRQKLAPVPFTSTHRKNYLSENFLVRLMKGNLLGKEQPKIWLLVPPFFCKTRAGRKSQEDWQDSMLQVFKQVAFPPMFSVSNQDLQLPGKTGPKLS
jgi:hypothetical protein